MIVKSDTGRVWYGYGIRPEEMPEAHALLYRRVEAARKQAKLGLIASFMIDGPGHFCVWCRRGNFDTSYSGTFTETVIRLDCVDYEVAPDPSPERESMPSDVYR